MQHQTPEVVGAEFTNVLPDPGSPPATQTLPDLRWLSPAERRVSVKGHLWPACASLPAWELSPCGSESVVHPGSVAQGLLYSAG